MFRCFVAALFAGLVFAAAPACAAPPVEAMAKASVAFVLKNNPPDPMPVASAAARP
jgi:hypothetical protein